MYYANTSTTWKQKQRLFDFCICPSSSLFHGYKGNTPIHRIRETLKSQNPTSANSMANLHILFVLSDVNSLASGHVPVTHPKRPGRSRACVYLPASQIPAYVRNLILSSLPRGSLMGGTYIFASLSYWRHQQ